jgi:NADPH-dependent curcumin reductase CurA
VRIYLAKGSRIMPPVELDKPLNGGCIGQVIKSRNTKFQVGEYVSANSGWREYWISQGADNDKNIITKIVYSNVLG